MRRRSAFALIALGVGLVANASADLLGGPGETCRSNNDCKLGLRCVRERCTDTREGSSCKSDVDCGGRACVKGSCVSAMVATPSATSSSSTPEEGTKEGSTKSVWSPIALDRVHPFVGATTLVGPAFGGRIDDNGRWDNAAQSSFLFALRGGLLISHHEIAVEVSPLTYFFYVTRATGPQFQVNGTYGYLVPLIEKENVGLYYPLRVGAGVFFANIQQNAYFQARADVVGLSLRIGHFFAELHAPSFRWGIYTVNGATPTVFTWDSGMSVTYAF
jgi:hypothetical protein